MDDVISFVFLYRKLTERKYWICFWCKNDSEYRVLGKKRWIKNLWANKLTTSFGSAYLSHLSIFLTIKYQEVTPREEMVNSGGAKKTYQFSTKRVSFCQFWRFSRFIRIGTTSWVFWWCPLKLKIYLCCKVHMNWK